MTGEPTLHGPRVVLRPGDVADIDALQAIRSEPSVVRWWGVDEPDDVRKGVLGLEADTAQLTIVIEGEIAGAIQYWQEHEPDFRHAGIDLYIGQRWQGQGYGREAIRLVVDHLCDDLGHHRLTIDPAAANEPAIRCYTAVGFQPVGRLRQYQLLEGAWVDGLLMELLASERPR